MAASPAASAQLRGELVMEAPSCVDRAELEAKVTEYLRRPAFEAPADIRIELSVVEADGSLRAEIAMRRLDGEERGRRVLVARADRCSTLAREIALVIALMLESDREEVMLSVPEPEEPAPVPLPAPAPAPSPPPREEPLRVGVIGQALGLGTFDLLPELAPGARGVIALDVGDAPRLAALLEVHGSLASGDGPRLDGLVSVVGLAACPGVFASESVRFDLCAGFAAGVLVAVPRGLADSPTIVRGYVDLRLDLGFSWAFAGGFGLRLEVGAMTPLTRPEFVYASGEGLEILHRTAPVVPRASLGVFFGGP